MRRIILLFLLISSYLQAKDETLSIDTKAPTVASLSNFTSVPTGIVHGCVNVISGDFFDLQQDMLIEGLNL